MSQTVLHAPITVRQ